MRGLEGPISSQEDLIVSRAWVWRLAARSGSSHQPLCSSEGSEALFCPLQALRSCVRMNSHTFKETKIDFFKSYRFRYALEKWGLGVRRGTFHGVSRSEGVILACGPGPASSSCALKLARLMVRLFCLNKLQHNKNVSQKLYSHGGEAFPLGSETYYCQANSPQTCQQGTLIWAILSIKTPFSGDSKLYRMTVNVN